MDHHHSHTRDPMRHIDRLLDRQAPNAVNGSLSWVLRWVVAVIGPAACAGGEPATTPSTVTPPTVAASVVVSPADVRIATGDSVVLTARALDAGGRALTGRTVTWASRAPEIVTVGATGVARALALGTARIEATVDGVVGSATVVTTPQAVATIDLTPRTAVMPVGGAIQLVAAPRDAAGRPLTGRTVTWASSDSTRLRVDAAGRVTALATGTATVTASTEGRVSAAQLEIVTAPATISAVAPLQGVLSVAAGEPPTVPATVVVRDPAGRPLAGVTVTFSLEGTARLEGPLQVTDAQGRATPTLLAADSIVPARQVVQFTISATITAPAPASPVVPVAWRFAAVPGVGTSLSVLLDGGEGVAGEPLPWRPLVRVADRYGNPVGIGLDSVVFAVADGGGSLRDSVKTPSVTGPGMATPGVWRLGATPGINRLRVTYRNLPPVTLTATGVASAASAFDVDVRFVSSDVPQVVREATAMAVARWRQIIVGDLPDTRVTLPAGRCGPLQPALDEELVDDAILFVSVVPLPPGVAAVGGPCHLRPDGSRLPTVMQVRIKEDEVQNWLKEPDRVSDHASLLVHEIGHALGIGTLTHEMSRGMLEGFGGADPIFTGPRAREAYLAAGGAASGARPVPVTTDGHLRPPFLAHDVMTNVGSGMAQITSVSAAILQDLGYSVNPGRAFLLPVLPAGISLLRGAPARSAKRGTSY